ncbi:MAG: DUF4180 domain-containing protein [Bacteroidota bacterium]
MKTKEHKHGENSVTEILEDGVILKNGQDFLSILYSSPSGKIILKKENIADEFFDLKTGIAGDIFQKASNYQAQLGIVGDFSNVESKSLRDLIYESNKSGKIIFKNSTEEVFDIFLKQ